MKLTKDDITDAVYAALLQFREYEIEQKNEQNLRLLELQIEQCEYERELMRRLDEYPNGGGNE